MIIIIFTDYVSGGELFTHLYQREHFNENEVRIYIAEIVLAMEQLHKRRIIYRDIKLENILLDSDGHIVITDFGLSKQLPPGSDRTHSFCGTIEYMAPEVVKNGPAGHDMSVDWWSVGVLCYELLTGASPFTFEGNENSQSDISQRILKAAPPLPPSLGAEVADFIGKLLNKDPEKRLGGNRTDARDVKAHPFFRTVDWEKLAAKLVPAPFKPEIRHEMDTSNFSEEFTSMVPIDSPSEVPANHLMLFQGYSFVAPELLEQHIETEPEVSDDLVIVEDEEISAPIIMVQQPEPVVVEEKVAVTKKEKALVPKPPCVQRFLRHRSRVIAHNLNLFFKKFLITFPLLYAQYSPFLRKYEITSDQPIGDGTFSICMRCRNSQSGEAFAVKVLARESHNKKTEIETLRLCQGHPNVVRLIEVLEDETFTYLVTELLEGGELNDRTARMTSHELNYVFRQLLDAVSFIHSKGVAHRDLKPENIVFESATSNHIRIVDFGFAKELSDVKGMNYLEYTLDYASPEVLHCNTNGGMSMASDYWSIGAIMYRSVCGRLPFGEGDGVGERIRRANYDKEVAAWKRVSPDVRQIIEGLLWPTPEHRYNEDTIRDTAWFRACAKQAEPEEKEEVAVVPMEIKEDVPMTQDLAVLADKEGIVDELELPLQVAEEDEVDLLRIELPSELPDPTIELEPTGISELVTNIDEHDVIGLNELKVSDEDCSSLHSMSSGEAAPIDDITTMELFNNNEKYIDEVIEEAPILKDESLPLKGGSIDEPPALKDERDRLMEEIHCEGLNIRFEDESTNANPQSDGESDEEFYGFGPMMIRCNYLQQAFRIPFRKRGRSFTMITDRLPLKKCNQTEVPGVPTIDSNTTAATNLSVDVAAAASLSELPVTSSIRHSISRTSGRNRKKTIRLADQLLDISKSKMTKPTRHLTAAADAATPSLPILPTAPPTTIPPTEASVITSSTTCLPPPFSFRRPRGKRHMDDQLEDIVTPIKTFALLANTTTTRSGRRSIIPQPFVQAPIRIKVEASH